MDCFKVGKGVHQGCTWSPHLFNFYAEYIMQKARLDEAQAEIKIAWRIPWTEEPGGLQLLGLQKVGYDLVTEHAK